MGFQRGRLFLPITAHDTFMFVVDLKDGPSSCHATGDPAKFGTSKRRDVWGSQSIEGYLAASFHPPEPRLYAEVDADGSGSHPRRRRVIEIARLSSSNSRGECSSISAGCPTTHDRVVLVSSSGRSVERRSEVSC